MVTTRIVAANMSSAFWDTILPPLIVIPVAIFAAIALIDVFRRPDLSRWKRATWVLAIVLVPLIGPISYLLLRPPPNGSIDQTLENDRQEPVGQGIGMTRADQLRMLAILHDAGKLTDTEFAAAKVRVLRDDAAVAEH